MGTLLAIDGSIRCVGVALFVDDTLAWTDKAQWGTRSTKTNLGERAATLAYELDREIRTSVDAIAYEWPQAYADGKNPNDLFGILAVSGHLVANNVVIGGVVRSYLPREWTGNIPKTVGGKLPKNPQSSPRGIKIAARLRWAELGIFNSAETHDEVDAIGIGLHHLGRGITKRKRVYPGAA